MNLPLLSCTRSSEPDGTVRIALRGELDLATAPTLRRLLNDLTASHVLLDLKELAFLDSSGVAVLIAAHSHAAEHDGTLSFTRLPPNVLRTFGVMGLTRLFHIQD